MVDSVEIRLTDAEKTAFCGHSLASTLYTFPLDIHLDGDLGAGKTTFVQGLARGLGIDTHVASPTYALEQRYRTRTDMPFIHIDLYRIDPSRCAEMLASSEDHEGIRCIEWASRAGTYESDRPRINISLREDGNGRRCSMEFLDIPLPSEDAIALWQQDVRLPAHIMTHCQMVGAFAKRIAHYFAENGTAVRPDALDRAGQAHDLLRFVDFKRSPAQGFIDTQEDRDTWQEIATRYPDMRHEEAAAMFLRERGFAALASIVEVHGLHLPSPERVTFEQKILYYADKRVAIDKIVSLQERFDDFRQRYDKGSISPESVIWFNEAQRLEHELFPDGPPF